MNLFDLVGGLTLVGSALIGLARGAVMEVVALFAFAVAAAMAVWLLPYTAPLVRDGLHLSWAANAVAVAASFLAIYVGLRLLGGHLSRSLRGQATLGALDRTAGLAFGVARGLVVLGVVVLVFEATPASQPPPLLTQARIYPLARGAGRTLASLTPGGVQRLEDFGQSLKARMSGEAPPPPAGPVDAGQAYGEAPTGTPADVGRASARPHRHRRLSPAEPE